MEEYGFPPEFPPEVEEGVVEVKESSSGYSIGVWTFYWLFWQTSYTIDPQLNNNSPEDALPLITTTLVLIFTQYRNNYNFLQKNIKWFLWNEYEMRLLYYMITLNFNNEYLVSVFVGLFFYSLAEKGIVIIMSVWVSL